MLEDSAGHFLNSLTRGNGEQVEAIKTNEDQVGTHGGRASQLTRKGTGFQNKTGSHVAMNGQNLDS